MRTISRQKSKPKVPSDLLIIECDSQGLARDHLDLGTPFGTLLAAALRHRRVALIQTSTETKLEEDLTSTLDRYGYFDNVLIVGHSNPQSLAVTSQGLATWPQVGERISRFRPKRLFLAACEAGQSETVRGVFEKVITLREIYASPVSLLAIHTAPMAVLIGMYLFKGNMTRAESEGLRMASFISWGAQTYCWRRHELGPGQELAAQGWDDLAKRLGVTNWDLMDEVGKAIKALFSGRT